MFCQEDIDSQMLLQFLLGQEIILSHSEVAGHEK